MCVCYICVSVVCGPGSYSSNGRPPCSPCPVGTYQPHYGRVGCRSCGSGVTTDAVAATSFRLCRVAGSRLSITATSRRIILLLSRCIYVPTMIRRPCLDLNIAYYIHLTDWQQPPLHAECTLTYVTPSVDICLRRGAGAYRGGRPPTACYNAAASD